MSLLQAITVHYNQGEQGWRSGESARLPPMCPGFDSRTRRHMWAEFVGSLLCSEKFFSGYSGFPLSSKTNIWFDLIWFWFERIVNICKFDLRIVRRIWKRTLNLRGINIIIITINISYSVFIGNKPFLIVQLLLAGVFFHCQPLREGLKMSAETTDFSTCRAQNH